jgi:prepilin-type N-terminal cleavage/methylation domain-containing protein
MGQNMGLAGETGGRQAVAIGGGARDFSSGHNSDRGFTLVELLVVIGIIALLIAILMPSLNKARVAAQRLQCLSNQRRTALGVLMYTSDNHGYGPLAAYVAAADDFSGSTYWVAWWNKYSIGQYIGVATRGKDFNPSSSKAGFTSLYDPRVEFLYCTAYNTHGANSDLGIGVNVRAGARIFRSEGSTKPQIKLTSVNRPSSVIMLLDIWSGITWEKYYFNESSPYNSTGGNTSGLVAYRHGHSTCVTFCDGHGETFQDTNAADVTPGFQTGIHAAYLSNQITAISDR